MTMITILRINWITRTPVVVPVLAAILLAALAVLPASAEAQAEDDARIIAAGIQHLMDEGVLPESLVLTTIRFGEETGERLPEALSIASSLLGVEAKALYSSLDCDVNREASQATCSHAEGSPAVHVRLVKAGDNQSAELDVGFSSLTGRPVTIREDGTYAVGSHVSMTVLLDRTTEGLWVPTDVEQGLRALMSARIDG